MVTRFLLAVALVVAGTFAMADAAASEAPPSSGTQPGTSASSTPSGGALAPPDPGNPCRPTC